MKIWTRFGNWIRGVDPRVAEFAAPTLLEIPEGLLDIVRLQVKAIEAEFVGNTNEFKHNQAAVRVAAKALGLSVGKAIIDIAIKLAVREMNKSK